MNSSSSYPLTLPPAPPRELRRAAQRRLMLKQTLVIFCTETLLLAALAIAGAVDLDAALMTAGFGVAFTALLQLAYRRRWNERFDDPYLALPQVLLTAAFSLYLMAAYPSIGGLAVSLLFIIFAFGALRLSGQQLLAVWALCSGAVMVVVIASRHPPGIPHATVWQTLLSALWMSGVLGQCAFLGHYGARLRVQLGQRSRELEEVSSQLRHMATRDGLTGSLNRGAILNVLSLALHQRDGGLPSTVAAVLVDLDHFKAVNDRHGHLVGDAVLRRFVDVAGHALRRVDRLGRYGGEEFLLVLPGVADEAAALHIAERVQAALRAAEWGALADGLQATASFGIACARVGESAQQLLQRADEALYRAKHDGRDRVCIAA